MVLIFLALILLVTPSVNLIFFTTTIGNTGDDLKLQYSFPAASSGSTARIPDLVGAGDSSVDPNRLLDFENFPVTTGITFIAEALDSDTIRLVFDGDVTASATPNNAWDISGGVTVNSWSVENNHITITYSGTIDDTSMITFNDDDGAITILDADGAGLVNDTVVSVIPAPILTDLSTPTFTAVRTNATQITITFDDNVEIRFNGRSPIAGNYPGNFLEAWHISGGTANVLSWIGDSETDFSSITITHDGAIAPGSTIQYIDQTGLDPQTAGNVELATNTAATIAPTPLFTARTVTSTSILVDINTINGEVSLLNVSPGQWRVNGVQPETATANGPTNQVFIGVPRAPDTAYTPTVTYLGGDDLTSPLVYHSSSPLAGQSISDDSFDAIAEDKTPPAVDSARLILPDRNVVRLTYTEEVLYNLNIGNNFQIVGARLSPGGVAQTISATNLLEIPGLGSSGEDEFTRFYDISFTSRGTIHNDLDANELFSLRSSIPGGENFDDRAGNRVPNFANQLISLGAPPPKFTAELVNSGLVRVTFDRVVDLIGDRPATSWVAPTGVTVESWGSPRGSTVSTIDINIDSQTDFPVTGLASLRYNEVEGTIIRAGNDTEAIVRTVTITDDDITDSVAPRFVHAGISSNNTIDRTSFVKPGDRISVAIAATEPIRIIPDRSNIAGISGDNFSFGAAVHTVGSAPNNVDFITNVSQATLPAGFTGVRDGRPIPFSIQYEDASGNRASGTITRTNDDSGLIFDGTAPTITRAVVVEPTVVQLFFSEPVLYNTNQLVGSYELRGDNIPLNTVSTSIDPTPNSGIMNGDPIDTLFITYPVSISPDAVTLFLDYQAALFSTAQQLTDPAGNPVPDTLNQRITNGDDEQPDFIASRTNENTIVVTFSKAVNTTDTTARGWTVSGERVISSTAVDVGRTITLTTSTNHDTGITPNVRYSGAGDLHFFF